MAKSALIFLLMFLKWVSAEEVVAFRKMHFSNESQIFERCDESTRSLNFSDCIFDFSGDFGRPGITSILIGGPRNTHYMSLLKISNFTDLESFEIQNNYEFIIADNVLSNSNLRNFKCVKCALGFFRKDFHQNLHKLVHLNVSQNDIANIDHFQGNTLLETLDLSWNSIADLKNGMFVNNKQLMKIDLQGNKIRKVTKHKFKGLSKLKSLNISENEIYILSSRAFEDLESLEDLDIRGNSITKIKREHFANLNELTFLSLKSNKINEINISKMKKLSHLDLSQNKITSLTTLEQLPNLKILKLQNNRIRELDNSVFAGLLHLEEIYLGENNLRIAHIIPGSFPECAFDPYNLRILSLVNNPGMIVPGNTFNCLNNAVLERIELTEETAVIDNDALDVVDEDKVLFLLPSFIPN